MERISLLGPLLSLATRLVSGGELQCPVCEQQLVLFLPFGVGLRWRKGALCPSCRSLERHRLVWLGLVERLARAKPELLHVAPEACFEPRLRQLLGERYVTVDLKRPDVNVRASIEALPFADGSFDAVICNHVLEHVSDDRRALGELLRVLRPGAWAILQVPVARGHARTREDASVTSPSERRRRFGQHDHVRWYGSDYIERLRAAGFEVEAQPASALHSPAQVRRHGLEPGEVLYRCRKPA